MDLNTKISEVRERLRKSSERTAEGRLIASRLHDDLIEQIEDLLAQNTIRRPELSEKLGLTLLQLTFLEEDIFQLKRQAEERRRRQEQTGIQLEPDIIEDIQFQAVSLRADDGPGSQMPEPEEASFPDSKTWVRIISMTGLKVEVNSVSSAIEILKLVLQAHYRSGKQDL
jgi:hypothetical protein